MSIHVIENMELRALVEAYLDAVRDGHVEEFLDELDDDQRLELLTLVAEETGAAR